MPPGSSDPDAVIASLNDLWRRSRRPAPPAWFVDAFGRALAKRPLAQVQIGVEACRLSLMTLEDFNRRVWGELL